MHFHAPRLVALRGGDRNEETPATGNEKRMLICRACARALGLCRILLLQHRFQPTTSTLRELASWLLLGACSMYLVEQLLVDWLIHRARCQIGAIKPVHRVGWEWEESSASAAKSSVG